MVPSKNCLSYDHWEVIVKFLANDQASLESLSLVSKQFLSLTNSVNFSHTIYVDQTPNPNYLPSLFHRFPKITSINLKRFCESRSRHPNTRDLDKLLCQISNYPLQLKSLNLSYHFRIPSIGFKALARQFKTSLKSLICSNIVFLNHTDLEQIANCFPFLEELELSLLNPNKIRHIPNNHKFNLAIQALSLALPNLRKFTLSHTCNITDSSLLRLFKNCAFLEEVEVALFSCKLLTIQGIASAIQERPNLKSFFINKGFNSQLINSLVSLEDLNCLDLSGISNHLLSAIKKKALPWRKLFLKRCYQFTYGGIFSLLGKCQFLQHLDLQYVGYLKDQHVADLSSILGLLEYIDVSGCHELTNSAMFALLRNCPLLGDIRMESTHIGKYAAVKDFESVNPHPRVKSLHLGSNSRLKDESIKFFASIFPNLEFLDLSFCKHISDEGAVEVLRRCLKIRHLSVKSSPRVHLLLMNFQVPKLEVLNLSHPGIDDDTLYVISKSCSGLLELQLEGCYVTKIGVRQVIKYCTKLRKINLRSCHKLTADVFCWMVNSRPSLRKIVAPRYFCPSDNEEKLLWEHGCLIEYV